MSWLTDLIDLFKKQPNNSRYAATLNGLVPVYSQFGTNIYISDVVQQALKCIVDEMKKLTPKHVRYIDSDPVPVKSTVQDVLMDPNPIMTTSEFLEKVYYLLLMNYNAFIIPQYYTWIDEKTGAERRYYESLWPVNPSEVDFIEDPTGRLFVKFWFRNGDNTTFLYDNIIHLKYNYSLNEFMGGNEFGQPEHRPLLNTLQLNDELLKGVAKAMKASYAINGVVKSPTVVDEKALDAKLAVMEQKLARSESGFLSLDMKTDFTPLERKTQIVDDDLIKFIDAKILRNWGISLSILTGDYTKEQYEAFYQKALEPLILTGKQAFTKKMFTRREKAFGNRIEFYPEELVFMTMSQKLEMVEQLSPTGALFENEKRNIFGMVPIPELEGKRYMSLNWVDAEKANQYQLGKVNVDVVDESKEETIEEG